MSILITSKSFIGEFQFQFQNNEAYWGQFIEDEEKLALIGLFGKDLYEKLKSNPADPDFDVIKEPFYYHSKECRGLKYIVTAFVYCQLIKMGATINSGGGTARIIGETSEKVNQQVVYSKAWNLAVMNARTLRLYLASGLKGLEDYKFEKKYLLNNPLW